MPTLKSDVFCSIYCITSVCLIMHTDTHSSLIERLFHRLFPTTAVHFPQPYQTVRPTVSSYYRQFAFHHLLNDALCFQHLLIVELDCFHEFFLLFPQFPSSQVLNFVAVYTVANTENIMQKRVYTDKVKGKCNTVEDL